MDSSLGGDHERGNTKKRADRRDTKDEIEQHERSDEKEESACDIGHVTHRVWRKGMTKLKQRGKAAKILLLVLLRFKFEPVISKL